MTADPRAEAEKIIRDALERWVDTSASYYAAGFYSTDADNATDAILDALTAAGWSLLPPGGQSHTEWRLRIDEAATTSTGDKADHWHTKPALHEPAVDAFAARQQARGKPVTKMHRTVHYGPWQPSDTQGEPA